MSDTEKPADDGTWLEAVTLSQEADTMSSGDQFIEIKFEWAPGGGTRDEETFYAIKTERWAFNSLDELVAMMRKAGVK